MSIHAPVFLASKDRSTSKEFVKNTKEDIKAVIELLYSRGMWSKYHYDKWKKELDICGDEAMLHGWWDSIVSGAMFEIDMEDIREMQRDGLAAKGMIK